MTKKMQTLSSRMEVALAKVSASISTQAKINIMEKEVQKSSIKRNTFSRKLNSATEETKVDTLPKKRRKAAIQGKKRIRKRLVVPEHKVDKDCRKNAKNSAKGDTKTTKKSDD